MNDLPRVNGRASDSQFAQNPLPIAHAMGLSLAAFHLGDTEGLEPQTAQEVDHGLAALAELGDSGIPPTPYARVRVTVLTEMLESPPLERPLVRTHGAPVVDSAVVVDSVVTFESAGTEGLDPAERDLAIVFRSISETFTSEVCTAFLDGYLEGGGELPHGPTLDWYAVVAAFR